LLSLGFRQSLLQCLVKWQMVEDREEVVADQKTFSTCSEDRALACHSRQWAQVAQEFFTQMVPEAIHFKVLIQENLTIKISNNSAL
jgi:hypothetical protein